MASVVHSDVAAIADNFVCICVLFSYKLEFSFVLSNVAAIADNLVCIQKCCSHQHCGNCCLHLQGNLTYDSKENK